MRTTKWTMSAGVALVLPVLTISGCSDPAGREPVEVATPMFASDEEAFAAAEATLEAYVAASNRVDYARPETFEEVLALTRDELNSVDRQALSQMHANATSRAGEATIDLVTPGEISASRHELSLNVCLNVAQIELLDADGRTVVETERRPVQALTVIFRHSEVHDRAFAMSHLYAQPEPTTCG